MRSPRSGAVASWRERRACRCRTTTNGGNRSRSRRSSASYWKVPSKPRIEIPRLATAAFAERLNEGRASETRELVQGPLMADPLMDVESERTKDREERLWIEALGREFASLLDRAVCEEDCSGRHPAPGEVGGRRRSEPLERVAVAEGRVDRMRDTFPGPFAGHLHQDARVAVHVPRELRRLWQDRKESLPWTRPARRPTFQQSQVAEELQRPHGRVIESEFEVDILHALPDETGQRVDLLVVDGIHGERADRRRELECLGRAERRHRFVGTVAPYPRGCDGLLDERLRAEEGDEGMIRARGRVSIADPDRFHAVHFIGREPGEDVADPRVLAHRAEGRQPLRPPRFGVGERIAAVVRGVEVVQADVPGRALDGSIEPR